ncbi:MAG: hypothetical protein DHS80DRAFT_22931 [Piptocephalis tieghemiana]|nr:MAG: hypothetical protein DHS80DRAFT_22931 [Piptocephalis tieghemiana]
MPLLQQENEGRQLEEGRAQNHPSPGVLPVVNEEEEEGGARDHSIASTSSTEEGVIAADLDMEDRTGQPSSEAQEAARRLIARFHTRSPSQTQPHFSPNPPQSRTPSPPSSPSPLDDPTARGVYRANTVNSATLRTLDFPAYLRRRQQRGRLPQGSSNGTGPLSPSTISGERDREVYSPSTCSSTARMGVLGHILSTTQQSQATNPRLIPQRQRSLPASTQQSLPPMHIFQEDLAKRLRKRKKKRRKQKDYSASSVSISPSSSSPSSSSHASTPSGTTASTFSTASSSREGSTLDDISPLPEDQVMYNNTINNEVCPTSNTESIPPAITPPPTASPGSLALEGDACSVTGSDASSNQDLLAATLDRQEYLLLLAKSELLFGAPTHRLSRNLHLSSQLLSVDASFIILPGMLLVSFHDPGTRTSETHVIQMHWDRSFGKLEKVDRIGKAVARREISVSRGIHQLREQLDSGVRIHPRWVEIVVWIIASFAIAPLALNGDWKDALLAGGLGGMVGMMAWGAEALHTYRDLFETTAAVLASFIASAAEHAVCYNSVVVGSIILILPTIEMTLSIMELMSNNLVKGSARLVYALTRTFIIDFGLSLGRILWQLMSHTTNEDKNADPSHPIGACTHEGISRLWMILLIPLGMLAVSIHLRTSPKQWLPCVICGSAGYVAAYFINQYLHAPILAPAVGALAIGIIGNAHARWLGSLAVIVETPSIVMLIPGLLGVQGSLQLVQTPNSNNNTGLIGQFTIDMLLFTLGVTVGLFTAALVVLPFGKKKHSNLMVL